jgi:hypothetical protein
MEISNQVIEELKNKNGDISDSWFQLYSPQSTNGNGENLFTMYLNYGIGVHHIDKFVEHGYQVQIDKVEPSRWDNIIYGLSKYPDFGTKLQQMTGIDDNPAYILLTLPTCHKFELFFKLHKKGYVYTNDDKNILKDMFNYSSIDFNYSTNYFDFKEGGSVQRWKSTMTNMVKCLRFMAKENLISRVSMQQLEDDGFRENFINHIFYMQESVKAAQEHRKAVAYNNQNQMLQANVGFKPNTQGQATLTALGIASTSSHVQAQTVVSMEQEARIFLKNLLSSLGKEYFEANLIAKEDPVGYVRPHRGKI